MPLPTSVDLRIPEFLGGADLRALNTFGLPGRAARMAVIRDSDEIPGLLAQTDWADTPRLILGGGSNIVLTRDPPGLVLKVEIAGRELVGEDAAAWLVRAGAGERWHDFVRWTLAQGWPGLENLSLIPGTVGAAPIQNIGAYGLELSERFECLHAVSLDTGRIRRFDLRECCFGYRDSIFKQAEAGRWLISSVTFRLPKLWQPVLAYAELAREVALSAPQTPDPIHISDAVIAVRRRKLPDPAVIGNSGSFFKNPVLDAAHFGHLLALHPDLPHYPQPDGSYKVAAGWLIDRCGWKGRSLGAVGCYERQALVLVNLGGATGAEVLRIAAAIQDDVEARFGLRLESEPVFA